MVVNFFHFLTDYFGKPKITIVIKSKEISLIILCSQIIIRGWKDPKRENTTIQFFDSKTKT